MSTFNVNFLEREVTYTFAISIPDYELRTLLDIIPETQHMSVVRLLDELRNCWKSRSSND